MRFVPIWVLENFFDELIGCGRYYSHNFARKGKRIQRKIPLIAWIIPRFFSSIETSRKKRRLKHLCKFLSREEFLSPFSFVYLNGQSVNLPKIQWFTLAATKTMIRGLQASHGFMDLRSISTLFLNETTNWIWCCVPYTFRKKILPEKLFSVIYINLILSVLFALFFTSQFVYFIVLRLMAIHINGN